MNYRVWDYFSKMLGKAELVKLHFKSKEAGGWPGNMMLYMTHGGRKLLSRERRMEVKEYFCPERCLYCLDKLNQFADISVGDNYTKRHSDETGSSSVIARTQIGKEILERYTDDFDIWESSIEEVAESQVIVERHYNYFWSLYKSEETGYPLNKVPKGSEPSNKLKDIRKRYDRLLKNQAMGKADISAVKKDIFKHRARGKLGRVLRPIINILRTIWTMQC